MASVGYALLSAAGVIFSTLFRDGAAELASREEFDAEALRLFLAAGKQGVQRRGGAKPGDKTVLDALAPAGKAAQALKAAGLDETM